MTCVRHAVAHRRAFRRALRTDVVFGTVNANRAHYEAAAAALATADRGWLSRLITRRVPLDRWREAFEKRDDDVKVVLDFGRLRNLQS